MVLASATVGNPAELATRLDGPRRSSEVTDDASPRGREAGSPCGTRPIVDEDSGARRSALTEALVADVAPGRGRTCDDRLHPLAARRGAAGRVRAPRRGRRAEARTRIKSYRAGYLAEDRRRIERQLADGELLAVASTNALELGIDIGSLDAAVLAGYPGTRASMWQQAGRAGRRDADSLAVLVAQDDPLDQYLVQHPEDLFDKPPEAAVIDPDEPLRPGAAPALRGARASRCATTSWAFFGDAATSRRRGRAHDRARASWRGGGTPGTTAAREAPAPARSTSARAAGTSTRS